MVSWQGLKRRLWSVVFLGVLSAQSAFAVPVLSITATPDPAVKGSPVVLSVLISGIADLYAFQYTLSFNAAVLQATGVTEGSFLSSRGNTYFDGGSIDNTAGKVSLSFDSLIGPGAGASGNGMLARIAFNVINTGTSTLAFSDVLFLDSALNTITVQADSRVLVAVPEPAALALFCLGLAGLSALRLNGRRPRA